jgi:hypothetical protein
MVSTTPLQALMLGDGVASGEVTGGGAGGGEETGGGAASRNVPGGGQPVWVCQVAGNPAIEREEDTINSVHDTVAGTDVEGLHHGLRPHARHARSYRGLNVPRVNVPRVNVPRVNFPRINVPRIKSSAGQCSTD